MPAKTSAKHASIRELLISSAALFPKKVAFEEKKKVITGRPNGATCAEYGEYVMQTLQSLA